MLPIREKVSETHSRIDGDRAQPEPIADFKNLFTYRYSPPDVVYRLHPQAPDSSGVWKQGRQVISRTVDSVQGAVAYERTTDQGHTFQVAFVNRSSTPITVAPTEIFAVVSREDAPSDTLPALDPENELLAIDKRRSREEAEAANEAATNVLVATLDVVGDIGAPPQSPEERTADAAEEAERERRRERERARHRRTTARLRRQRAQWAQSALRRTTLFSGANASGFVIVPVPSTADRLTLHVPIRGETLTVPYRQEQHDAEWDGAEEEEVHENDREDDEYDRRVLRP